MFPAGITLFHGKSGGRRQMNGHTEARLNYQLRTCTESDAELLARVGRETYHETFAHLNRPDVMEAYLNAAFDIEKVRRELRRNESVFFLLSVGDDVAGYLKLNWGKAQTDRRDPTGMEIERIYLKRPFQGRGLGKLLFDKAKEVAAHRGMKYLWLSVWQRNENAVQFYERMGFRKDGTRIFVMAEERQTDFVMRYDL
jgi:ribosomal protein S18 acetylase RimI-like enzyme